MSGVNDELITRLRAEATMWNSFRGPSPTKEVLTAAADALEAAQAENGELVLLGSLREAELVDARAERDAEAARADANATHCNEAGAKAEHWHRVAQAEAALAEIAMRGIDLFVSDAADSDVAAAFALAQEMRDERRNRADD